MQVNIIVNLKNMILQPSNRGFRSNRMSGSNPDRNELNIGEYENLRMETNKISKLETYSWRH